MTAICWRDRGAKGRKLPSGNPLIQRFSRRGLHEGRGRGVHIGEVRGGGRRLDASPVGDDLGGLAPAHRVVGKEGATQSTGDDVFRDQALDGYVCGVCLCYVGEDGRMCLSRGGGRSSQKHRCEEQHRRDRKPYRSLHTSAFVRLQRLKAEEGMDRAKNVRDHAHGSTWSDRRPMGLEGKGVSGRTSRDVLWAWSQLSSSPSAQV